MIIETTHLLGNPYKGRIRSLWSIAIKATQYGPTKQYRVDATMMQGDCVGYTLEVDRGEEFPSLARARRARNLVEQVLGGYMKGGVLVIDRPTD